MWEVSMIKVLADFLGK